jgi:hypothetical protein
LGHCKASRARAQKASEGIMIRKHQVCDRCGGRFGLVMHRWWGNKFCKRTCKDAYLREVALDRDTIRRRPALRVSRAGYKPFSVPLYAFDDR